MSLLRILILARLLGPENFGVGAVLLLLVSLPRALTDALQSDLRAALRNADPAAARAAQHLHQIILGLVGALLLAGLAWPAALFFRIPHESSALFFLALVPLILGFARLGGADSRSGPPGSPSPALAVLPAWAEWLAQLVLTGAAAWLAICFHDWWAVLGVLILEAIVATVLSHAFAVGPYRCRYESAVLRSLRRLAGPLPWTALVLAVAACGDRWIIAGLYSMRELGWYALAVALTRSPVTHLARCCTAWLLPLLCQVQRERRQLVQRFALSAQLFAFAAALVAAAGILLAPDLAVFVCGPAYAGAAGSIVLLALMQAVRLLRLPLSVALRARGDACDARDTDTARSASLSLALACALLRLPFEAVAGARVLGESVAFLSSAGRLVQRHAVALRASLAPAAGVLFGFLPLCLIDYVAFDSSPARLAALLVVVGLAPLFLFSFFEARHASHQMLLAVRRAGRRLLLSAAQPWPTSPANWPTSPAHWPTSPLGWSPSHPALAADGSLQLDLFPRSFMAHHAQQAPRGVRARPRSPWPAGRRRASSPSVGFGRPPFRAVAFRVCAARSNPSPQ